MSGWARPGKIMEKNKKDPRPRGCGDEGMGALRENQIIRRRHFLMENNECKRSTSFPDGEQAIDVISEWKTMNTSDLNHSLMENNEYRR